MNYSDPTVWSGQSMTCNFGADLCRNSLFVLTWHTTNDDLWSADVTWFNDPYALSGYVRYQILRAVANKLLNLDFLDSQVSLEEYVASGDDVDDFIRKSRIMLAIALLWINNTTNGSPDDVLFAIKGCLSTLNSLYTNMPEVERTYGATLICGLDELHTFCAGEMGPFEDARDKVERILMVFDSVE